MVGASGNDIRPSYFAMMYLLNKGYKIIPVNPGMVGKEILGQKVYASLKDVPAPVDMVDIFRESQYAPDIAREAVAEKDRLGVKVLWMQLGVISEEAEKIGAGCRPHRDHEPLPQDRAWPLLRRDRLDGRQPQGDRQPQAFAVRQGRQPQATTIRRESGMTMRRSAGCDRCWLPGRRTRPAPPRAAPAMPPPGDLRRLAPRAHRHGAGILRRHRGRAARRFRRAHHPGAARAAAAAGRQGLPGHRRGQVADSPGGAGVPHHRRARPAHRHHAGAHRPLHAACHDARPGRQGLCQRTGPHLPLRSRWPPIRRRRSKP